MRKLAAAFSLSATLLLGLCVPAQTEVAEDFKKEHPTYTLVSVRLEWADSYTATYLITFRKPGDERLWEVKWEYTDANLGEKKREPGPPEKPRLATPAR
jgi:hypothetical protein